MLTGYINVQTRPVVFMGFAILIVPIVYALPLVPDVCAVPPDRNFAEGSCAAPTKDPRDGRTYQTCCWKERVYPYIGEKMVCQTCSRGENVADVDCSDKVVQLTTKLPKTVLPDQGAVLEDSTTPPKFTQNIVPKTGVLQQGNLTFSEANITSNNDTVAPTLKELDIEADKMENETSISSGEEEQDESENRELTKNEQPDENENNDD